MAEEALQKLEFQNEAKQMTAERNELRTELAKVQGLQIERGETSSATGALEGKLAEQTTLAEEYRKSKENLTAESERTKELLQKESDRVAELLKEKRP